MTDNIHFTITKCRNAKNRWNIHLPQPLNMLKLIETMKTLKFRLVANTPALLVFDNESMRTTFYKDGLIQVDSFSGTFPKTEIESIILTNAFLDEQT